MLLLLLSCLQLLLLLLLTGPNCCCRHCFQLLLGVLLLLRVQVRVPVCAGNSPCRPTSPALEGQGVEWGQGCRHCRHHRHHQHHLRQKKTVEG